MAAAHIPVPVLNREELVQRRLAEKQRCIDEAKARSDQARENEDRVRTGKIKASNRLGAEMDKWAKQADGKEWKDIRSLLSTLHEVMWPNSGWQPVSLSDLIADGAIKKHYRKAIIVSHPDRHQEAETEQQFRAERVFQALNESWKKESK